MTSDLSICAARVRDFIDICADEFQHGDMSPELAAHADIEFNGMALVLFALQFANNAPYRKFCESRKVFPDSISRWSEIPAMPTAAFKEFEVTSLMEAERRVVFHSSGTTEQRPSRHFHNEESLELYEASLWPWFVKNVGTGPRMAFLCPPPAQVPHSSLVHMFKTVRRKVGTSDSAYLGRLDGDGTWTLDLEGTLEVLNASQSLAKPQMLLGTAFSFVHLIDHLAEKNLCFQLPAGSRVMETGGYKGRSRSIPKNELHTLITSRLGIPASDIICEYGMSELSSQAYDNAARRFVFPPWARVQIVSAETGREVADGETGMVRVFDLANVFSVMAVQTEDMAIRRGAGFELIGRAVFSEPRGCSLTTA